MKDISDHIKQLFAILTSQGYAANLFGELGGSKPSGSGWVMTCCPFHSDNTPSFAYDTNSAKWKCHGCNQGGDWLDYLQKKRGMAKSEAIKELEEAAGRSPKILAQVKKDPQRVVNEEMIAEAMSFFKQVLLTSLGADALQYLLDRGYTLDEIKQMPVGCFPSGRETLQYLTDKGYSETAVLTTFKWIGEASSDYSLLDCYKIAIPVYSSSGGPKCIWGRRLEREAENKYKPLTSPAFKTVPFNAQSLNGLKRVVLVEGQFDALAATVKGFNGVLGLCGSEINDSYLKYFNQNGIEEVILLLDNDIPGRAATEKATKTLQGQSLAVFVANLPQGFKDPDELLVSDNGTEAFRQVLASAQQVFPQGTTPQHSETVEADSMPPNGTNLAKDLPLPYTLSDLKRDVLQDPEGLKTGFEPLDKVMRIAPGSLTIVAGRPGEGKTTFQINLLKNLIKAHSDKAFLFFSYEEQSRYIALKLISSLAGEQILPHQSLREVTACLRDERPVPDKLVAAIEEYRSLTETQRLFVLDKQYNVEEVVKLIQEYQRSLPIGAVCIDYIQKIPTNHKAATRQLELQRISGTLLEAAKALSLPFILGAQFGRDPTGARIRLDKLRESGDIEQDAAVVLGLEKLGESSPTEPVEHLSVTVLKNRNGPSGGQFILEFEKPAFAMRYNPSYLPPMEGKTKRKPSRKISHASAIEVEM